MARKKAIASLRNPYGKVTLGSAETSVKLHGWTELAEGLHAMPKRIAATTLRSAVQSGAVWLAKRIAARAPSHQGYLKRDIRGYSRRTNLAHEALSTVEAGVWYARLVEKGHKLTRVQGYVPSSQRRISLKVRQRKLEARLTREKQSLVNARGKPARERRQRGMPTIQMVKPRPFMRPGFDAHHQETGDIIGKALGEQIVKSFAKLTIKSVKGASKRVSR